MEDTNVTPEPRLFDMSIGGSSKINGSTMSVRKWTVPGIASNLGSSCLEVYLLGVIYT